MPTSVYPEWNDNIVDLVRKLAYNSGLIVDSGGGGGGGVWGFITGDINNQVDLQSQKASLASPAFTGNPTAPTQAPGNSSTRLATTAFVAAAISGSSPIDGEVQYYADLPVVVGTPPLNSAYLVREWSILNPTKFAGIWVRLGNGGTLADWTYAGEFPNLFSDAYFSIYNSGDSSKVAKFLASSISAATTRVYTFPDADGTLALTSQITANPVTSAAVLADLALVVGAGGARGVASSTLSGIPLLTSGVPSASNVTNDAQTKAAIVPNTAPASGQLLVGNAIGTAYAPVGMSGDATLASTGAITLATVNGDVGTFGSATSAGVFTVTAKGLITAASSATITPAVGSITGLGTNVATALAVNVGIAGAFITFDGAAGTPSSLAGTNITGTAAGLTAGTVTTNANLTGPVTSVGNATTITDAAVTLAKMANLAQDQFIGRVTPSTGVPETATITATARTVLDDTTIAAMLATLGVTKKISFALNPDPGDSVITTGIKNAYTKSFDAGTLVAWTLICRPSGSITIDILRSANGAGLPVTSIVGAGTEPAVSGGVENSSTSFASWTSTAITSLDNWVPEVTAADGVVDYSQLTLYFR